MKRQIENAALHKIMLFDIIYVELGGKVEYTPDDTLVLNTLIKNKGNLYKTSRELKRTKGAIRRHAHRLDQLALLEDLGMSTWIGTARRLADVVDFKKSYKIDKYGDIS